MEQLLIVEDDIALNKGLCKALRADNRQIISCPDMKSARRQLLCGTVSLVLLDINLSDGSGLDFLREIKNTSIQLPVILLTANNAYAAVCDIDADKHFRNLYGDIDPSMIGIFDRIINDVSKCFSCPLSIKVCCCICLFQSQI